MDGVASCTSAFGLQLLRNLALLAGADRPQSWRSVGLVRAQLSWLLWEL